MHGYHRQSINRTIAILSALHGAVYFSTYFLICALVFASSTNFQHIYSDAKRDLKKAYYIRKHDIKFPEIDTRYFWYNSIDMM